MGSPRANLDALVAEIRRRHAALQRAWTSQLLDRVAAELAERFRFEEALVRSLIREEVGERGIPLSHQGQTRTRADLEAMKDEDGSGS